MALSSESKFGVKALTAAVNKVPATPTQIRDLGIFEPQYLTTSYVDVECQEGRLNLVQSKERGTPFRDARHALAHRAVLHRGFSIAFSSEACPRARPEDGRRFA